MVIKLTPKNEVPADGFLELQFPYWFSNPTDFLHYIPGTHSCASLSGMKNGISCVYNPNSQQLIVTNILDVPTTSEMIFTVEGFSNPIATGPTSGFTVKTLDNGNGYIDIMNVDVTVTLPAQIVTAKIQPLGTKEVGEPTIMNVIV